MAGLALKGVRAWQAENLGKTSYFKGSILLYPNLYASTPLAGEAPNWEPVVSVNQAPVMILQPEQGVHRWYMPLLMQALSEQGAAVFTWVLPGVKDYFFNPFEKTRSDAEQKMTERLPEIFKLSAQRLDAQAPAQNPSQLAALSPAKQQEAAPKQALPKLHQFDQPKQAPGLVGRTFDGEMMDLADWRGKVVLVNFWATWCPPCVHEIPSMNRLLAKYRDQGLEIFSVDFQQSADEIAEFVNEVPVDYPIVLDLDGRVSKDWGVFSFPTTFVVDREGRVRYSLNQGVEWDVPELEAPILELLKES
jgi:thiol-disulfide isomerase/thioredoxin